MLLAIQYTRFPLSDLEVLIDSVDRVLTKPFDASFVSVNRFAVSVDDIYHVMLACGLQYDVVQVIFICCPAITVIDVGVSVTEVTGTEMYIK